MLAARVRDYAPAMLDELTATGEVLWAGHGALPGTDGWVSLHLADQAPPDAARRRRRFEHRELHQAVLDALAPGGAWFFRQLSDAVGVAADDTALSAALWDLVWAGRVTNDTLAPLRALIRGGTTAHRSRRAAAAAADAATTGRPARLPGGRTGPPDDRRPLVAAARARHRPDPARARHGRAPARPARRGHPRRGDERAGAGRVRRGLQGALGVRGVRPLPPRLLRRRARRGPVRHRRRRRPAAHVQPSVARPTRKPRRRSRWPPTDPANPYGAALPWPGARDRRGGAGHRPGRKAGALVVLVDGELDAVRRARRPDAAHLVRRPRPARPGRAVAGRGRPPRRRWAG